MGKSSRKLSKIVNLQPGQVCVYNLRALCGLPAIKIKVANTSGLEVFAIDYEDHDYTIYDGKLLL